MSGKITIKDIAAACGVTHAVASTVLGNRKNGIRCSDATRKKIQETAASLNYKPNHIARSLVQGKTHTIGLILPIWGGLAYFPEICISASNVACNRGYSILSCNVFEPDRMLVRDVELLLQRKPDGIISLTGEIFFNSHIAERIMDCKVPLLSCFCYRHKFYIPQIVPDIDTAVRSIIRYLNEKGHKNIVMLSAKNKSSVYVRQKEAAFRSALYELGLPFSEDSILGCDMSVAGGTHVVKESLLSLCSRKVTALVAVTDILAVAALRALVESGLRVPDDIAVTGFDNDQAALRFSPMPITTLDPGKSAAGQKAVELLCDIIDGKHPCKNEIIKVKPEIKIRSSA